MHEQIVFGVDVGGTFIKFGLFSQTGELLHKWQVPTGDTAYEQVLRLIAHEIECNARSRGYGWEQIGSIGIGVPGSVDTRGIVVSAPNLGWEQLDFCSAAKRYLPVPVRIGNDANTAALGEQHFGSGRGCASMVLVTLGTGVGGGVIIDGHLLAGAFGGGGEIGHMIVNTEEKTACTCGRYGCLEQYVSATGIAAMAKRKLEATNQESSLRRYDSITAKEVFDALKEGDALAAALGEEFGEILGRALAAVANIVDPQLFVIGGGVSAAGEVVLQCIEKYYRNYAFTTSKETPFELASLGNDAGIYGAARLAMQAEPEIRTIS